VSTGDALGELRAELQQLRDRVGKLEDQQAVDTSRELCASDACVLGRHERAGIITVVSTWIFACGLPCEFLW
jgi:hypothetical protein